MHNAAHVIVVRGERCLIDDSTGEVYSNDGTFLGIQNEDGTVQDMEWSADIGNPSMDL